MAGLVPAIPIIERFRILIEIAGTSPAMTPRLLLLLLRGLLGSRVSAAVATMAMAMRLDAEEAAHSQAP